MQVVSLPSKGTVEVILGPVGLAADNQYTHGVEAFRGMPDHHAVGWDSIQKREYVQQKTLRVPWYFPVSKRGRLGLTECVASLIEQHRPLNTPKSLRGFLREPLYPVFLAAAFGITFSIALGQGLLALAGICWVVALVRRQERFVFPAVGWIIVIYVALAWASVLYGLNREQGIDRVLRLFWLAAVWITAGTIRTPSRMLRLMQAFTTGCAVLAVYVLVRNPIQALRDYREGVIGCETYLRSLIAKGGMTDGQFLMIGIVAGLGVIAIARRNGRPVIGWWCLVALEFLALVVNFKRGSWACALALIVLFILMQANWRYMLIPVGLIVVLAFLPPIQDRVMQIKQEFRADKGGRITMWFKIAPCLIEAHPWGIGYGALTSEMMKDCAPEVEPYRDHLHSNIPQVLVSVGWVGLTIYLVWMAWVLADAIARFRWSARAGPTERTLATIVLLMLLGLFTNGVIEYNIGDSEVLIAYALLMGLPRRLDDGVP